MSDRPSARLSYGESGLCTAPVRTIPAFAATASALDGGTTVRRYRYRDHVSTNLRLNTEVADALRAAALASGRSQQDIIRDAVAKELGMTYTPTPLDRAIRAGLVKPPAPFQDVVPTLQLPEGYTTLDLLDRDDDR